MFAGEGDPFRTNRRFKYLSANSPAKRLSTAFDSVTLYGRDPDERPDILWQSGYVRRVDLYPGRCQRALCGIRPQLSQYVGLYDHKRSSSHDAGNVLQRWHRATDGKVRPKMVQSHLESKRPISRLMSCRISVAPYRRIFSKRIRGRIPVFSLLISLSK